MFRRIKLVLGFSVRQILRMDAMKRHGYFRSTGEVIQDSLALLSLLLKMAGKGYTEVFIKDPVSGDMMSVAVPSIKRIAERHGTSADES